MKYIAMTSLVIFGMVADSLSTRAIMVFGFITCILMVFADMDTNKLPQTDQPIADQTAKDLGMNRFWVGE